MTWYGWIQQSWGRLSAGGKIEAPSWLPSPATAGFAVIAIASPEGQSGDWGLSMNDGSRVHVHVFPDGRRVVHRDRFDPARSIWSMIAHLLTETWVGPVAAVGAGVVLAKAVAKK